MTEVTLGLAVLLAVGLLTAKILQAFRLPSVTGFILAGLLLGPSGFGLITIETIGHKLDHFTQIALMLIAFGIGEHIELRKLRSIGRAVGWISIFQAVAAFICVILATYFTALLSQNNQPVGPNTDHLVLSLLLGAVAVATAPAAILHVTRELGARGPLTSTLMAVVAVDDGIAIMIFGMTVSAAHQILGSGTLSLAGAVFHSVSEITFSLVAGVVTGFCIDLSLNKLHNRGEMLTGGLALLLLCGEATRILNLSPLLAGMAAGFTIINRAERDVRLFRTLNAFEPPIYVLFFTLAGVHLDLAAFKLAGWVGVAYFIARIIGKYFGTWLGGFISQAPTMVRNYLGLALIPQAGVAIGLIFLISGDPALARFSEIITPVVLAGVVLSELSGPLLVRHTLKKAGETIEKKHPHANGSFTALARHLVLKNSISLKLIPWTGEELRPASKPQGIVVFGTSHFSTARGLARFATILSHHFHALPMAVRVLSSADAGRKQEPESSIFLPETDEVKSLGYPLQTEILYDTPASGLVAAAEYNNAKAIVLGYPTSNQPLAFQKVLNKVAANVLCPVITIRFTGTIRFHHILVPFIDIKELEELSPVLEALATVTHPHVTFLCLLHSDSGPEEIETVSGELNDWLETRFIDAIVRSNVEVTESRLESIIRDADHHDIVIMTAGRSAGIKKLFFGSLANTVAKNCGKTTLIVYTPEHHSH